MTFDPGVGGQQGPYGPFRALRGFLKGSRVGQLDLLSCIIYVRSVLWPFEPFQSIFWRVCQFLPMGGQPGPNGPFRALLGYLKGPRVGQLDLLSCIIHVRSVLGPFEPFQSIFWRACQFLPVGGCPGQKKLFCLW